MFDPAANTVLRRYNFKLYPTRRQAAEMQRQAALLAVLWNAALEQRETQWSQECQRRARGERKGITKFDQTRSIKDIRADDPEYAAMSSATIGLCVFALDDAFKAFFRRAKGGAGASSGYPRYKSVFAIENKGADCTIWHRDHRAGWRLDRCGKHFKVYAKGISGMIKARGKFPVGLDDLELRDMRLIRVGGTWQISIVVKMEPRRNAGPNPATIEFDLIDEFASVKGANGECLPGWNAGSSPADERIIAEKQGCIAASGGDTSDFGGDGRPVEFLWRFEDGGDTSDFGGDGRRVSPRRSAPSGGDTSDFGGDGREGRCVTAENAGGDTSDFDDDGRNLRRALDRDAAGDTSDFDDDGRVDIAIAMTAGDTSDFGGDGRQSSADIRFKKFSYRWKREMKRIAKMKAKEARQRKDALHRYTTHLVSLASEVTAICPPVQESTRSAKGDERNHGAAVKVVAALNRHVLAQAPAMAIQMIEYKSAEAGIPFARITPDEHALAVGRDLPAATKAARKASRSIRRMAQ